jgi:hypothetical protein
MMAEPAGLRVWQSHTLHTLRMERSEYRDDEEDENPPDAYWRRRVITLALGLGLLGILAWGFSGGGAKSQPDASSSLVPATALGTAVPGLPGGLPGHPSASPSGSATGPATGTASPSATPSASPSSVRATSSPRPSARPGPPASASGAVQQHPASGGQCPAGSVVLSLFTDRTSYSPGEYPEFQMYAVSTYPGSCQFDPGQLQVNVLSEGRIIWDSADCSRGSTAHPAELARGVPAQAEVIWNREITLPGCQVLASAARDGVYQVQARTNTVTSPTRYFKLAG